MKVKSQIDGLESKKKGIEQFYDYRIPGFFALHHLFLSELIQTTVPKDQSECLAFLPRVHSARVSIFNFFQTDSSCFSGQNSAYILQKSSVYSFAEQKKQMNDL